MPGSVPPLPIVVVRLLASRTEGERDEAWSAFVEEYSRLLMHVARSVTSSHDDAMDGYAYVLGRLQDDSCARIRTFAADGRSKFTTWLTVIARRLCIDQHRARFGRVREGQTEGARNDQAFRRRLGELAGADVELSSIVEDVDSPSDLLIAKELRHHLDCALESLDPGDRLLLKLRFEDDLSAADIARALRLPTPFHVYRRIDAITTVLRRLLAARGVVGGAGGAV